MLKVLSILFKLNLKIARTYDVWNNNVWLLIFKKSSFDFVWIQLAIVQYYIFDFFRFGQFLGLKNRNRNSFRFIWFKNNIKKTTILINIKIRVYTRWLGYLIVKWSINLLYNDFWLLTNASSLLFFNIWNKNINTSCLIF